MFVSPHSIMYLMVWHAWALFTFLRMFLCVSNGDLLSPAYRRDGRCTRLSTGNPIPLLYISKWSKLVYLPDKEKYMSLWTGVSRSYLIHWFMFLCLLFWTSILKHHIFLKQVLLSFWKEKKTIIDVLKVINLPRK